MLKDGIPIVYQGQEHHYAGGGVPHNREALWSSGYRTDSELYSWITKLNGIRSRAIEQDDGYLSYNSHPIYSDDHTISMRKGRPGSQLVGIFTNVGSSSSATANLSSSATGFEANQMLVEVMSCTEHTADLNGGLTLTLANGLPRVLYPKTGLLGSGICPELTGTATTTAHPTPTPDLTVVPSSTNIPACSLAAVDVTFNQLVNTTWGDTVMLAGNTPTLGDWSPSNAVRLDASQYTDSNPIWSGTVRLAPGTVVQYKFIQVGGSGTVTWEADPNRVLTVPCTATTVSHAWK